MRRPLSRSRITNADIEQVQLSQDLKTLMAPLFKEATLGSIDLGEEEFIEACKNLIKNSNIPQRFLIINRNLADRAVKQQPVSAQVTGKPAINQVSHMLSFNSDYAHSDVFERLVVGRESYLKGKAPPAQKKKSVQKQAPAHKKAPAAGPAHPKKSQPAERHESGASEHQSEAAGENHEEQSDTQHEEEGNSGGGSPDKIFKQHSQISERPSEQNVTSDPENTHPYAGEHGEEEQHEAAEEEHAADEAAEEQQPGDEEADQDGEN